MVARSHDISFKCRIKTIESITKKNTLNIQNILIGTQT